MTNIPRSTRLIAARMTDSQGNQAQVVAWRDVDNATAFYYRRTPDADNPGSRWQVRHMPPRVWVGSERETSARAAIGTLTGYLGSVLTEQLGTVTVDGVWTVDFSEKDHEALDEGQKQPNNLMTKVKGVFDRTAPQSFTADNLSEALDWFTKGPLLNIDGDLSEWTESVLKGPTAAFALAEGEDEGIVLSNGKTRFLPRLFWGGLTDVTFLRQAREAGLYVLLVGPPGTGKSALVEASFHADYAAAGLNFNEDALIVGTEDTTVADLIGGMVQGDDGIFRFKPGKLIKCAEAGVPAFIDEALLIDPRVLSVVYSLIDGRGVLPLPEEYKYISTDGTRNAVKAQPGFYIVFAGNPGVPGAVISEALASRCTLKPEYLTDYDTVERLLGKPHAEIVRVARNMETKRQEGEVLWAPQMREMLGYRDVAAAFGTEVALSNLIANCESESDREVLADVIARTMKVSNIRPFQM